MTARILRGMGAAIARVLPMLLLLVSVTPAGAAALEPGVHGDPGSPAGKEYAFPLRQARGMAGGGLFGHGITRFRANAPQSGVTSTSIALTAAQRRAAGARLGRAGGSQRRQPGQVGASRPATASAPGRREAIGGRRAASATVVSDGSSGAVWMFATALCVIAAGALGGQALARGGRGSSRKAD